MLRVIVIALVLANVLLLGFQVASRAPEPAPAEPAAWERGQDLPPIRLLHELEPAETDNDPAWQCFTIGPFETRQRMQEVRAVLESRPGELEERRTEALMELGYWVSLPSFESFGEAGKALQGLREAGLDDLAVVADETGQYHVSLGYFLLEANARKRRDRVRELGYDAVTRLQRESQPRYWLDLRQMHGSERPDTDTIDELPPGLYRVIPCSEPELEPDDDAGSPEQAVADGAEEADEATTESGEPVPAEEPTPDDGSYPDRGQSEQADGEK